MPSDRRDRDRARAGTPAARSVVARRRRGRSSPTTRARRVGAHLLASAHTRAAALRPTPRAPASRPRRTPIAASAAMHARARRDRRSRNTRRRARRHHAEHDAEQPAVAEADLAAARRDPAEQQPAGRPLQRGTSRASSFTQTDQPTIASRGASLSRARSGVGRDHDVLEPHAEPAGEVDAGLDAERVAGARAAARCRRPCTDPRAPRCRCRGRCGARSTRRSRRRR